MPAETAALRPFDERYLSIYKRPDFTDPDPLFSVRTRQGESYIRPDLIAQSQFLQFSIYTCDSDSEPLTEEFSAVRTCYYDLIDIIFSKTRPDFFDNTLFIIFETELGYWFAAAFINSPYAMFPEQF